MDEATKQALLSAIRSILAAIGGVLVAKGYTDDQTLQTVIGAVMTIIPIVWGIAHKYQTERQAKAREAVALNAGIAMVNAAPSNVSPVSAENAPAVIKQFTQGDPK